jgi:hypothetical protein
MSEQQYNVATTQALMARFQPHEHEERNNKGQSLTYIPWACVAERLNQVFGIRWGWEVLTLNVDAENLVVWCHGRITYTDGLGQVFNHDGVGADSGRLANKDLDNTVKTAMAEAFKKAAHTMGIGLYLWDKQDKKAVEADKRNGVTYQDAPAPTASGPAAATMASAPVQPAANPPAAASAPVATAQAEPGKHGSEEWKAASRELRAEAAKAAAEAGITDGTTVANAMGEFRAVLFPGSKSTTDLTDLEIAIITKRLKEDAGNRAWFQQKLKPVAA